MSTDATSSPPGNGATHTDDQRRHPIRGLLTFVLVPLLGPPLGGLFLALYAISDSLYGMGSQTSITEVLANTLGFMVLAYVPGTLPALICGVILGYRVWARGWVSLAETLLVTAVVAFLVLVFILLASDNPGNFSKHNFGVTAALFGLCAIAALAGHRILLWLGVLIRPQPGSGPSD